MPRGGVFGDSIIKAAPTRHGTSTPADASAAIKNPGLAHLSRSVGSSTDVAARIDFSEGGLGDEGGADDEEGEGDDRECGVGDAEAPAARLLKSGSADFLD